jgi:hypothetical protein
MPRRDDAEKIRKALERFPSLPDDAVVPVKITALILGTSERVVRYSDNLRKIQVSPGRYGISAGEIRKLCRGGISENGKAA